MPFEISHTKNRKRSIKQHIKYFNIRSKIQLDHPVVFKDILYIFPLKNPFGAFFKSYSIATQDVDAAPVGGLEGRRRWDGGGGGKQQPEAVKSLKFGILYS